MSAIFCHLPAGGVHSRSWPLASRPLRLQSRYVCIHQSIERRRRAGGGLRQCHPRTSRLAGSDERPAGDAGRLGRAIDGVPRGEVEAARDAGQVVHRARCCSIWPTPRWCGRGACGSSWRRIARSLPATTRTSGPTTSTTTRPNRPSRSRRSASCAGGTCRLIERASPQDLKRVGVHAERGEESVEHLRRLYAGHDLLHLQQIARIRHAVSAG